MPPKILTTGIGSLPFTNWDEALAHVFAHYSLPFFPSLVRLTPEPLPKLRLPPMVREILTDTMSVSLRLCDGEALIDALDRAEAQAFLDQIPGFHLFTKHLTDYQAVKLQLVGPCTAAALLAHAVPSLTHERLVKALITWLKRLTEALAAKVQAVSRAEVLFIWDDGLLADDGQEATRQEFCRFKAKLAESKVTLGVHSCTPGSLLPLIKRLPAGLLAIDFTANDHSSPLIAEHVSRGGTFIFGILDTSSTSLNQSQGRACLDMAERLLANEKTLMISGGCGTGLHHVDYEKRLALMLKAWAQLEGHA